MLSGVITGLVAFIAVRVLTGLGEGAFYSNDRSLIAEQTPREKRSLGMGVVITGLALGITIATVFAPEPDRARRQRVRRRRGVADAVPRARRGDAGRRHRRRGLLPPPAARAAVRPRDAAHARRSPRSAWPRVMAVYFVGDAAGLSRPVDRGPRGRARADAGRRSSSRAATASVGAVLRNRAT